MAARRLFASALVLLVAAAATLAAASAQPLEAPSEKRYAAWRDEPFTCSQLIAADASKNDSVDETGNYKAITEWEAQFPKLRERHDLANTAELQTAVLKWCNDAAATDHSDPVLADVVEKVWRMMGY
jgi:hypothetical protein